MLKKEKKRATDAINQLDQTGGGHPGSTYSEGPSLNGHEHKSSRMAAGFAGGESNHQRRRASSMDAGLSGKQSKKSDSREPSDIEEKTKKKICMFGVLLHICLSPKYHEHIMVKSDCH